LFTHLASRTTFIDGDRYLGEDWLGYWMPHELGTWRATVPRKKMQSALRANIANA
jgi:hypothetical protein